MVDFKQRFHNTDKFRQAALHFLQYGTYTDAPRGTSDYVKYWDLETERCLNGYTAEDGEYITGYHYFYLNYSPIYTVKVKDYVDRYGVKRQKRERSFGFPSFWDYDAYYFYAIDDAESAGLHMAVLKCRKRGYSFKSASMLVRNYELIPGSKNFAIASELKFLIGDGILTKAWAIMDFIDKNTAWSKQRLKSTSMERTSGFKVKDEFGKETEQGYQSSIIGITLKNDPERIRGTRGKLFIWEEAGKFDSLQEAWSIARSSLESDDGVAFGAISIAQGTGGTESAAFDGLKDMFYHPDSYNIYSFPNIWDEDADENSRCAFFCPQWSNMEGFDEDGNQKFMDKDGNSLRELAIQECVRQRKVVQEGKGDQLLLDRFVAERPLTPAEAILELGGNIFPRKLLLNQLSKLRTNTKLQSMKHVVDLRWDGNGGVEAVEKKSGDITTYPLKNGEKPEGSIVIWEYPVTDPPYGLYIAGNDPYDQNESGTNSLGSTIIFKRFKAGEAWTDVIVAEYSGRPNTADEYYENVRKLLTFYNARCLYENEKLGIYQYFVNKHCDYLLADQPDKVIAQIFRDSKVNRKKGCHMTKLVRLYAEEKINEWLREEYEPGHPNLERIYSEPLLEELIMNNGERNVDRVIALCMVMIFREELYLIKVQEHKDENKLVQLFDMPLFGAQWWREPSQDDDVPIFTF